MHPPLKILILEDHSDDAVLIEKELHTAKIECITQQVDNKKDFIQALHLFAPDLILSEYTLPQFNGIEALKQVQRLAVKVPVIIISGAINEETAVDIMKAGATDYVIKDRLSRLVPAVNGALEKKRTMMEKAQAEDALVASETRYRRLFESAREGIILLEGENKVISDTNPFLLNLLEYSLEDVLGKPLWQVVLFDDQTLFENQFKVLDKDGYLHIDGLKIHSKSGISIMTEMTCSSYSVDDQKYIQCNIRDITERIDAEAEKEKIRAQLFQAQKMEAIGTLAGGVAHDFNNLMTAIQVSADIAMMSIDEEHGLYKDLKEIRFAALRASGLIRQLLLFSREHPMEFSAGSLNTVIENLLKMLHRLIGEDIEISTQLSGELWTIRADTGNMEQVIMNLALNARDAMPEGGKISIHTKNLELDEDFCKTIPEARPGQFICLSIRDTGMGMDKETIERIFEPFFTTKPPGKGTGLGLAVVYGIIKQHNGWIHVNSTPNLGTTFQVYLPAVVEMITEDQEKKVSIQDLHGNGERILMVEDEDKVREFAAKAMVKCGYDVVTAHSAEQALIIFEEEKGNFQLVFSDVVLSDKTGIELVDSLVSAQPDLKIILSSGYMDHKLQWPRIKEKGYFFLQKPYALPDLLKALKECIER